MKVAFLIPSTTKNRPWKKIEETYLYTVFGKSFLNTLSDDIDYSIYINIDIDDPIYSKKEEKEKFERFIGEKAKIKWIDDGYVKIEDWKNVNPKELLNSLNEISKSNEQWAKDNNVSYSTDISWIYEPSLDQNKKVVNYSYKVKWSDGIITMESKSLKLGIGAGIGLFLAIIGLEIMGVVGDHPVTLVTLGDIKNPLVLLACATFVFMIVLEKMKVKGNIIIGILLFSIIAWATGLAKFNGVVGSIPPMTYLFEFDLKAALSAGMASIIFTLLFIDFFDTAGTLTKAAELMMELGANSVRAVCTHGVFSGPAYERINNSVLEEIIVTDTISKNHGSDKVKVISIAELFANSIDAVLKNESISKNFLR